MKRGGRGVEAWRALQPYLRQDGDPEGLAAVGGPEINGELGEEPPGRLPFHPAG